MLVLAWAGVAGAQPLSAFLDASVQGNVDGRVSATEAARASASFGQAWGALLPALSANGGWTHNQYDAQISLPQSDGTTKTITIVPKDQLDATLKAELPLIDATKWAQVSAASAARDAAEQRVGATRASVQRQVVAAFYGWVAARQTLESARRSLAVSEAQVEFRRSRQAAGVGSELDLTRASAEVERNHQLVAAAGALLANRARTLETLTGLAPKEAPAAVADDGHPPPDLAQLESRLGLLPSVAAAESDATAAGRTQLAATLALVPTVNAQFTQRFTNATGFQNASAQASGGVTFSWRLDLVGVNALRVQAANQDLAVLNAERARRAAADQLHADWQNLEAALIKAKAAGAQVTAARRATELTAERNGAGVATQLDVIQAERDLFAAEVSQVEAAAELATARAQLNLSAGLPLEATP
ncbi:MAG: TolC family protein [Myxococcaceae bacterium]